MTLSRTENDAPRPDRGPEQSASTWDFLPGRRILALLRRIRRKGWASLLEQVAPGGSWRAASGGDGWSRHGRRTPSRTFYPTVDGRLEARMLLTYWHVVPKVLDNANFLLKHPGARAAFLKNFPPQVQHAPTKFPVSGITRKRVAIATQTAHGGQSVEVTALDGSHYMIKLSYTSNTIATDIAEGSNGQAGNTSATAATALVSQQNANYPQPIGTIRAYAMPGGRVGIIVDGSTANTDLTINPLGQPQKKGFAKSFAYGEAGRNHLLNIGQISVTSGQIGAIEGFQVAELSGPLQIAGTTPVDRIALGAILPGASIQVGGDLQTLDVATSIDLSGSGTGINIGRDLNLLNVGGFVTLSNNANFIIGRDLGLISQPPKGTATGSNVLSLNYTTITSSIITVTIPSVGSFIQSNVNINPGSVFGIGGLIYNTMYVEGSVNGYSRLLELYGSPTQFNPPFLTSLAITNSTISSSTAPPTQQGPAPTGYVVALQGVIP